MTLRSIPVALVLALLSSPSPAGAADGVVPPPLPDARAIPEPAVDEDADALWWDGARNMTVYQAGKVLDLGRLGRSIGDAVGIVGPREATNVNALDEVPDSTWFTNRHAPHPLSIAELVAGRAPAQPPSADGPLRIRSGKSAGQTPGFVVEDRNGDRFLLKFDPPAYPDLATGAEIVSGRILHALGWNVPDNQLVLLDPARLELAEDATTVDEVGDERPLRREDVDAVLEEAARRSDGRYRALASRFVPGEPKGPFRTIGRREDDPNDLHRHENRRELRGLRAVAAWIHYTDARRGNFHDTFLEHRGHPRGWGHLEHYLLDFSSTLGSGNIAYKPMRDGHEYVIDPPIILASYLSLGLWVKPWQDPPPIRHRAIGPFDASIFVPEDWRTTYPQPLFDHATSRDHFWGTELLVSIRDEELRAIVDAGRWSEPGAAEHLFRVLLERRAILARTYFSTERLNPVSRFEITDGALSFTDLAVASGVVAARDAVWRYRVDDGEWAVARADRAAVAGVGPGDVVELRTSHDRGRSWSPPARITVGADGRSVVGIERETTD